MSLPPAGADLLRDAGIAVSREIHEIEGLVDEVVVELAGLARLGAGPGEGLPAAELVDEGGLPDVGPAEEGHFADAIPGKLPEVRDTDRQIPPIRSSCAIGLSALLTSSSRSFRASRQLPPPFWGRPSCCAGALLLCFFLAGAGVFSRGRLTGIEVHQLDHGHLRPVTGALAQVDDARIPPGTGGDLLGDRGEQLLDHRPVLDQSRPLRGARAPPAAGVVPCRRRRVSRA